MREKLKILNLMVVILLTLLPLFTVRVNLAYGGDFQLLWTDKDEGYEVDLKDFYVKYDDENVTFKFTTYRDWQDPEEDFHVEILFNIDKDRTTGSPEIFGGLGEDLMIVLGETANGFEHAIYTWKKDGFVVNSFLKDYHIECNSKFATLTIPRSYFKDDFEYWICIVNNFNGELDYYPDDEDNPYAYFKFGETRKETPTSSEKIVLKLKIGSKIMYVNDTPLEMDVSPIIREGRTLLPIRYIAEPLGAEVGWDGTEKKVTVSLDDIFIELWIGRSTARVNGVEKPIDPNNPKVKPIIVPPGRTMLPVRFVAENLGCKVDWEQETRTVVITYEKP